MPEGETFRIFSIYALKQAAFGIISLLIRR